MSLLLWVWTRTRIWRWTGGRRRRWRWWWWRRWWTVFPLLLLRTPSKCTHKQTHNQTHNQWTVSRLLSTSSKSTHKQTHNQTHNQWTVHIHNLTNQVHKIFKHLVNGQRHNLNSKNKIIKTKPFKQRRFVFSCYSIQIHVLKALQLSYNNYWLFFWALLFHDFPQSIGCLFIRVCLSVHLPVWTDHHYFLGRHFTFSWLLQSTGTLFCCDTKCYTTY